MDGAQALLGALLVRRDPAGARIGRIVEVEAYGGEDDAASHARSGRTGRNGAMYGPPGHAYVYRVYGMHHCLNVVTGPPGRPSAVLVRAVEPVASLDAVRAARVATAAAVRRVADPDRARIDRARIGRLPAASLASGPGLVAAAFSVTLDDDGSDLCAGTSALRLGLARPADPGAASTVEPVVTAGPRVGIAYAAAPWDAVPWRLWLADSPAVSRARGARRSAG